MTSVEAQLEPDMLFPASDSDDSWMILGISGKTSRGNFAITIVHSTFVQKGELSQGKVIDDAFGGVG